MEVVLTFERRSTNSNYSCHLHWDDKKSFQVISPFPHPVHGPQREYAAPKIIPSAANVATKLFLWKAPTEIRNSPRKLLVPGELILAKVEEKEMVGRFGMVLTEPP
ncbi:hypothetical protein KSP40_PGU010982 [Platanthera guangdongensis]|uniref:Uncharacterized protein n=1 Tax=Platanthera guangdongensis TaxID=2320717 RepID=A0ABR2M2Y8_9ASPA